MKYRKGILISDIDTRTLEEIKKKKLTEVNRSLFELLEKTDWEVIREMEYSSNKKMNPETFQKRQNARVIADDLQNQIAEAKDRETLDQMSPKIEGYLV